MSDDVSLDTAAVATTAAVAAGGKKLNINVDELLDNANDDAEKDVTISFSAGKRRHRSPDKEVNSAAALAAEFADKPDAELKAQIERITKKVCDMEKKLPDGGLKLKQKLQRAKEELERRLERRRCAPEVTNEFKRSESSRSNGLLDGPKQSAPFSQRAQMSKFGNCLLKKIDDASKFDSEQNTSDKAQTAFGSELSFLNPCDKRRRKEGGMGRRANPCWGSKEFPPDKHRNGCRTRGKRGQLTGFQSSKVPLRDKQAVSYTKIGYSKGLNSNSSKIEKERQTVVLVDEEEHELNEDTEELPSTMTKGKIYYPSKEASESLEIFRCELKCLEPGECLTSTIMNFYVRFLQEMWSSADRVTQSYYFFNTYFYRKLQEAVSRQKSEKEAFFIKFRRWWKGVNLFQKAFIFLPINEDNHWSLVIICMPDEEDSGPFILHLDSLGLHCSTTIFANIKSLVKHEWEYMCGVGKGPDCPFPEKLWKNLPQRIDEKIISVPRQTNDYDCGLFVLYFMERFIEDAPRRLKKEDLSRFGKNWFKPAEASSLRGKLKKILQGEFHKASLENDSTWQPVLLSADTGTDTAADSAKRS